MRVSINKGTRIFFINNYEISFVVQNKFCLFAKEIRNKLTFKK